MRTKTELEAEVNKIKEAINACKDRIAELEDRIKKNPFLQNAVFNEDQFALPNAKQELTDIRLPEVDKILSTLQSPNDQIDESDEQAQKAAQEIVNVGKQLQGIKSKIDGIDNICNQAYDDAVNEAIRRAKEQLNNFFTRAGEMSQALTAIQQQLALDSVKNIEGMSKLQNNLKIEQEKLVKIIINELNPITDTDFNDNTKRANIVKLLPNANIQAEAIEKVITQINELINNEKAKKQNLVGVKSLPPDPNVKIAGARSLPPDPNIKIAGARSLPPDPNVKIAGAKSLPPDPNPQIKAAAAAQQQFDADKIKLARMINDARSRATDVINGLKSYPHLNVKHGNAIQLLTALDGHNNALTNVDINGMQQLKNFVLRDVAAFNQAVDAARTDLTPLIADHVRKHFKEYAERIKLLEYNVNIFADTKKDYQSVKDELKRLQQDLEAYSKKWSNDKYTTEARQYILQLKEIIDALDSQKYRMRTGEYSEKISGSDKTNFEDNAANAIEALLQQAKQDLVDAGYTAAKTGGAGTISQTPASLNKRSPYIELDKLDALSGQVTVDVTTAATKSKKPIISSCTESMTNSGPLFKIKFDSYDNAKRLHTHNAGLAFSSLLLNDRMKRHVMENFCCRYIIRACQNVFHDIPPDQLMRMLEGGDKESVRKLIKDNMKPVYVSGNFDDDTTLQIMMSFKFLGVECHDNRNPKLHKVIKEIPQTKYECFEQAIQKDPERYTGKARPFITSNERTERLAEATKPRIGP